MEPGIHTTLVVETGKKINYRRTVIANMPPHKGMKYRFGDDLFLTVDAVVQEVEDCRTSTEAEAYTVWVYIKKPKHVTVDQLVKTGFDKYNH